MSDRCMERREMSPGGREMVTSGGERGGDIKTDDGEQRRV